MQYRVGLGVEGRVNGYYVHVGSERFLRQNDIKLDQGASERVAMEDRGCSTLFVAVDGQLAGVIAYEDRIRDESRAVIAALHGMGVAETIMLTGDNDRVAGAIRATPAGIDPPYRRDDAGRTRPRRSRNCSARDAELLA